MMIGIAGLAIAVMAFMMGFVMADMGNEIAHENGWEEGVQDVINLLPPEYVKLLAEDEEVLNEQAV